MMLTAGAALPAVVIWPLWPSCAQSKVWPASNFLLSALLSTSPTYNSKPDLLLLHQIQWKRSTRCLAHSSRKYAANSPHFAGRLTPPVQSWAINPKARPSILTLTCCNNRETRFAPQLKAPRAVGGVTPSLLARWAPILSVWGVGAGAAVLLFASDM